ncbi:MAG: glycosyltransferase [Prevotella sp.]|nr:glycosyltransferase [Prevotella sp.]
MKKLSIIIPVYNVEKYIRPCMESIFRQGLDEDDYEVIIINDGTEDRSMEVIEDIIAAHSNITVINQKNLSLSVARNNGIAAAKGEYILMPDSDDLLIENSLKPLLDKALETKVDLVVADFMEMGDEKIAQSTDLRNSGEATFVEKTGKQLFLEDLNPRQCYVWRTLYRRAFITGKKLTFVPGIRYQDVPFTHEAYLKAGKCLRTHWLLNIYRKGHESAATASFNKKKAHDLCIAIAKTWRLRKMKKLPLSVRQKLDDDIFVSFSLLIYFMLYGVKDFSDREEIFNFLRKRVPKLKFTHGVKQRVTSMMYRFMPHVYFFFRLVFKWVTSKPNFG